MPTGESADSISALLGSLGPSGIAVGMVVGIYVAIIFNLWGKLHFMQDSSVPDFVTGWINVIVPNVFCLGIMMVLVNVLHLNISELIMSVFMPIAKIGQTLPGFILCCLVPAFFYTMGVSSWMFGALTTSIFMAGIDANIAAVAAGLPATNIVTSEATFTLAFVTMGGVCATLGLNVLMCFSKSKQLKTLGRVFMAPSIFNINEPIVYGAPVAFNPTLMIPFWLAGLANCVIVWIAFASGFCTVPIEPFRMTMPSILYAPLALKSITGLILHLVCFGATAVIYYPFFKVYDKQCCEEESKTNA